MLENLRRQGSSVFIYVIFGILIAMFVINFRPGGQRGDDSGCSGATNTALSVDGDEVNLTSFRVAFQSLQGPTRARTEAAFEMLIRRELLATEARAHGLIVSDSLIDDEIKAGMFFLGGQREKLASLFDSHDDGTQTWNFNKFKRWVSQFNVSVNSYRDEQQRELTADLFARILGEEVRVSREEALKSWLYDHNTVTYDSVIFRPDAYRGAMRLTDEDAARFLATHEAEVKARFTADQALYEKVPAQVKVREIYIAKAEPEAAKPADEKKDEKKDDKKDEKKDDKKDDKKPAGEKADDKAPKHDPLKDMLEGKDKPAEKTADKAAGAPKTPAGMPIEEAKAKLEAARAEIAAGKKKFADVAKDLSTDEATKWNGGAAGWRDVDAPALGDKAVNEAIKTLKAGDVSPVITTDRGAYLVTIEGTRSGKLDYDAKKLEIAATLAKDAWAKEAAHRDALAALERARAGTGKNLDQIFERAPERPEMNEDLQRILNDPNLTQEQKQDALKQFIQMQRQHGSITVESKDQPVAWYADPDGAGGGSAPAPAAGSAGSAAAAPVDAKAPATAEELSKPSADTLPAFGPVTVPQVNRNGPAPQLPKLPGVGTSKAAADALFNDMTDGMIAKQIYLADGNYVVLQLIQKQAANMDAFDKEADHVLAEMRARRSGAVVEDWLRNRCELLAKANRISWSHELLRETGPDGKPIAESYKPCQSFHRGGGAGGALDLDE